MRCLLRSDVWLLLILAAAVAAVLVTTQSPSRTAKLGAFFTVLGDGLTLLALYGGEGAGESVSGQKTP